MNNRRFMFVSAGIVLLVIFCPFLFQQINARSSSLFQERKGGLSNDALQDRRLDWERRKENLKVEDLRFENDTKGLTIISKEREGDFINLKLRNDYTKTVTAFVVAVAKMTIHTETLTGADYNDVFLPGDIREESYFLQLDVDKLGIKLLAVAFEDGTTDGTKMFVDNIRQYRSGMKMQREHSLALLKGIVNTSSVDLQSSLANLQAQAPQISQEKQRELPYFVRRGLLDEQDRFLRLIQHIKGIDVKITKSEQSQMINKIIENYTKTLKQL